MLPVQPGCQDSEAHLAIGKDHEAIGASRRCVDAYRVGHGSGVFASNPEHQSKVLPRRRRLRLVPRLGLESFTVCPKRASPWPRNAMNARIAGSGGTVTSPLQTRREESNGQIRRNGGSMAIVENERRRIVPLAGMLGVCQGLVTIPLLTFRRWSPLASHRSGRERRGNLPGCKGCSPGYRPRHSGRQPALSPQGTRRQPLFPALPL